MSRFALLGGPRPGWAAAASIAPAMSRSGLAVSAGACGGSAACLCACGAGWVHVRERRLGAAREQRTGAARCSLGARTPVHVCSVILWITRHCSWLTGNLIKELPDQIFDKTVKLTELCVDSHRLAGHARGGAPATPMWRPQCEGACAAAWNWGFMRAPVRRSAFESSAWCLLGACMGASLYNRPRRCP